jgi:hypothetical protein
MKKKKTVYLESTIPSYLASRPSRDLIVAGHQQLTEGKIGGLVDDNILSYVYLNLF